MRTRLPAFLAASLTTMSLAAAPALATDSPAPDELAPAPPPSALSTVLGKCTDNTRPSSTFNAKEARKATSSGVLRGTAHDTGCGVAMVNVSIMRVSGKKCKLLSAHGKLGKAGSCARNTWLMASGTKNWHVSLKRLPRGTYRIRTRAVDFANNAQRVGPSHRVKVR
jgi:hypothetical protein